MHKALLTGLIFTAIIVGVITADDLPPVKVSTTSTYSAGFGYYNVSPESPDGQRLLYAELMQPIDTSSRTTGGRICVKNIDLSGDHCIGTSSRMYLHNMAMQHWVNDDVVAYSIGQQRACLYSLASDSLIADRLLGELGHNSFNNRILLTVEFDFATREFPAGIYEYDVYSRLHRRILDLDVLKSHLSEMDGSERPTSWNFKHVKFSPLGTRVMVNVDTQGSSTYLFTFNAVDGSDLRFFGPSPVHVAFHDENSVMGADNDVPDGLPDNNFIRRWSLDGEYIETLAGFGNHVAMSADRQWLLSDNAYNSNRVELFLYRRGETTPRAVLMKHDYGTLTWDVDIHVNPSFSPDGKRAYFSRAVTSSRAEAVYVDISSLVGASVPASSPLPAPERDSAPTPAPASTPLLSPP